MNFELVVATNNAHKLKEIRAILSPHKITVYGLNDLNLHPKEVEENGKTYKDNALIKAESVAKLTTLPIIADDSGLEILSLNNKPGIYSARFASEHNGYEETFKYIERELTNKDKSAVFICNIILINVEDRPLLFEGRVEGEIVKPVKAYNGFGYDPIFFVKEAGKTYAEMSDEEKNKCSHRGKALQKLLMYLRISGLSK